MQALPPLITAVLGILGGVLVALIGVWATRTAARQQQDRKLSDAVVTSEEDLDRRRIELYDAGMWSMVRTLQDEVRDLKEENTILKRDNLNLHRQNDQQQRDIDQHNQTISDLRSDIRNLQRRPD